MRPKIAYSGAIKNRKTVINTLIQPNYRWLRARTGSQ